MSFNPTSLAISVALHFAALFGIAHSTRPASIVLPTTATVVDLVFSAPSSESLTVGAMSVQSEQVPESEMNIERAHSDAVKESRLIEPVERVVRQSANLKKSEKQKALATLDQRQRSDVSPTAVGNNGPIADENNGSRASLSDQRGSGGEMVAASAAYYSNPSPAYPAQARRLRQEGAVLLLVKVNPNGEPVDVTISSSSGYPTLDNSALAAVRKWRFRPATVGGQPVTSQVSVPLRFELKK